MSSPESVSSRIANFGLSSSSCRISCRFFSPPEKPSFRLRSANWGSMDRAAMASRISLRNTRSFGASPRTAVTAVRRKLDTVTPGTSTGYCMARNSPARARASTLMVSTSSPSSVTDPLVTWYFGWPAIAYARVDLPEPFGPMMACVCPADTVRSTPRRISRLPPAASSTLTCRSRMSRVAIASYFFRYLGERDVDVVALDLHLVGGHRLGGRRPGGVAGAQVKTGPVQPALHGVVVDLALGQRDLRVRADVTQRVNLALGPDDRDRLAVHLDPDGPFV